MIQESKLTSKSKNPCICNNTTACKDRPHSHDGGLAIFIHRSITFCCCCLPTPNDPRYWGGGESDVVVVDPHIHACLEVFFHTLKWFCRPGGVGSSRLWCTSQLLRLSDQHCSQSGVVCPQIQEWQCGAYVSAVEEMVCVVYVSVTKGHSGDGCDLASTLCKYDLRKGDLFILRWARVRRGKRVSISSELPMCCGGVRSSLLLPLVARCLETIDVCIWRMFVFMSVVMTVWGSVGMFVV